MTGRGAGAGNEQGWLMATINAGAGPAGPGEEATVASVQMKPGPASVQGDPERHPEPRLIQNKQDCWQRACCAGDAGRPYLLTMPPFRHMARFWLGAYVLVVEYF